MSDVNGDNHRARRRAVRSVGPPVEEAGTEKTPVPFPVGAPRSGAGEAASSAAATSVTDIPAGESVGKATAAEKDTATARDEPSDAVPSPVALDKVAAETVAADSEAAETATPDEPAEWAAELTSRVRVLSVVAAAVLVLAMVVGAGASIWMTREAGQRDDRRAEYTQTARQAVLNLTTIRADSAKEDIDRILSLASGQFKSEFDGRVDPFMSIVQQAKVVSNGEIVEAAIQDDDENSGTVLVAAKQTLTNAGQAEPQTRYYRFRVTVTRTDSGLSASKVEFVA